MSHDSMPARPAEHRCDVLVIGGGPAGSTAATLLAGKGSPGDPAGESAPPPASTSVNPCCRPTCPCSRSWAYAPRWRPSACRSGGRNSSPPGTNTSRPSSSPTPGTSRCPSAYQVRRSEFDEILIRNAARKGGQCHSKAAACATWNSCRTTKVPSSGRNMTMPQRDLAMPIPHRRLRPRHLPRQPLQSQAAQPQAQQRSLYGHFKGAQRHAGKMEGNISIFWFEHGWFWFIPLADGATSVGAVTWPAFLKTRQTPVREFFLDLIALCPALAARLKDADSSRTSKPTGNFSL